MLNLRSDRLDALIKARYGSVYELETDWEVRFNRGEFPADRKPPNRTAVYRWIDREELPRYQSWYLRLCALLDADPFCLLQLPKGGRDALDLLYRGALRTNNLRPVLGFLREYFPFPQNWPPPGPAAYFQRGWCVRPFTHTATRTNYYAQIELRGEARASDVPPQLFHFAYRSSYGWAHFGFVERGETAIDLLQFNGQTDRAENVEQEGPTIAETWFGEGACEFRVASLHPFALTLRDTEDPDAVKVRFFAR